MPGSSRVYRGGIISYTNEVKSGLLTSRNPPPGFGRRLWTSGRGHGPGAQAALSADVAVSTTGLAGHGGDGFGNPVGTVWIACAGPGGVESVLCRFQGNREEIREAACCRALELVLGDSEWAGDEAASGP